ncbi:MAG: UTP--glucose-1-phosphate uridylyltransferase [Anaerolineae bacterium]|nr:UTP--glucose-1-phosphate uridylyltransferase [Anaerolineae bacterium]
MPTPKNTFTPFAIRMQAAGLPAIVIDNFRHYYEQLASGETGLIPESTIVPVSALPDAELFADDADLIAAGEAALPHTVIFKLNGGLGTSMGLTKAKSLLTVRNELTFLDIIARQAIRSGNPLVLMNSFNTRDDSLAALMRYDALQSTIPLDFLQHKVPKIVRSDLSPASYPDDDELAWNPPGHGDIYIALVTSGMLDTLLAADYRYAFVSNSDNLGAVMETAILGYFVANQLPFMMEAADRTESDKKGGHLAQRADGRLILRESAQCPDEDGAAFQNVTRHRYFNTNNLWIRLPALKALLDEKNNVLGLPMIRNAKTIDPRDPGSTPVYQIETAMGSAIGVFAGAGAVRVPRSRFAPVKTTDDLLAVRSDAYVLTADDRIALNPQRTAPPMIELDSDYYRLIDALEARFPFGPPSLVHCDSLRVDGDVRFGRNVTLTGSVHLKAEDEPLYIADNTTI